MKLWLEFRRIILCRIGLHMRNQDTKLMQKYMSNLPDGAYVNAWHCPLDVYTHIDARWVR